MDVKPDNVVDTLRDHTVGQEPKPLGETISESIRDESISELADVVADLAHEELERRHPEAKGDEPEAFSRTITSDELDAQVSDAKK
jgi:hypothetical protein